MLEDLGCDSAQGWYVSRPLPAERATEWLLRHPSRSRALRMLRGAGPTPASGCSGASARRPEVRRVAQGAVGGAGRGLEQGRPVQAPAGGPTRTGRSDGGAVPARPSLSRWSLFAADLALLRLGRLGAGRGVRVQGPAGDGRDARLPSG